MSKIEKAKNHNGETIFPVTVADAVLMGNGQTLKGKLSELGSKVKYITSIQNYESGVKLNSNGTISPQENVGTSEFISVKVNEFYNFVAGGSGDESGCLVVYDINKNPIAYWTGLETVRTIGTGDNGVYVRFSFVENNENVALLYGDEVVWRPIHKGKLQDIDGKIRTLSEQVKSKAEKSDVDLLASDVENIHSEINNLKNVQNYESGVIQDSVGNTYNQDGVGLSEFIPVEVDTYYEFIAGAGSGYLVVFDENKNSISYWAGTETARTIGIKETGSFVRFSFIENLKGVGLFREGETIWTPTKKGEIQRIDESIEETRQSIVKIQSENSNITIGKYVTSTGEIYDNPRCFIAKIDKSEIGTGWLVWKTSTLKEGILAFYDINGNYLGKQWPNNDGGRSFSIGAIENAEYIIATFAIGDESSGITNGGNYVWKPEVDFGAKKLDAYDFNVYDIVTSNRWHHTELLQQLLREERDFSKNVLYPKPVMLMHFTDNHSDYNGILSNIKRFYDVYKKYINDTLCTGDFMSDKWTDSFDFWNEEGMGFVLNAIGNHDVWDRTQPGVVYVSQKEAYDRYFAPYINSWMVTQPSNADANGCCYYYKDYSWQKIRLIVLDCMHYDDNQNSWLASVLDDARNNDIAVVCASHYAPSLYISTFIADSSFTTENRSFTSDSLDTRAVEAVKSFIDNGGEFISWVTGHNHLDYLATLNEYGNQFVINSDSANNSQSLYGTSARVQGTKSGDCFNCISFDRFSHTVRFVRIGVNYDMWMRKKETFCYDYKNNRMIYSD